jgi:electron-transferring-flavoprotein dehydrogenase
LKHKVRDHESLIPAANAKPIDYPKPDGVLTFDILDSVSRSATNHRHDQPAHLKLQRGQKEMIENNLKVYDGPEGRFCPGTFFTFL